MKKFPLRLKRLINPDLPKLVKQRYGTELRSRTLASIKPEISQALDSLCEELQAGEDAKAMRASVSYIPKSKSTGARNKRACPLCREAKRPYDHFLSKCTFLPPGDRNFIAKARTVVGLDHNTVNDDSDDSDSQESANLVQRVVIRQSPYVDTFHSHISLFALPLIAVLPEI